MNIVRLWNFNSLNSALFFSLWHFLILSPIFLVAVVMENQGLISSRWTPFHCNLAVWRRECCQRKWASGHHQYFYRGSPWCLPWQGPLSAKESFWLCIMLIHKGASSKAVRAQNICAWVRTCLYVLSVCWCLNRNWICRCKWKTVDLRHEVIEEPWCVSSLSFQELLANWPSLGLEPTTPWTKTRAKVLFKAIFVKDLCHNHWNVLSFIVLLTVICV